MQIKQEEITQIEKKEEFVQDENWEPYENEYNNVLISFRDALNLKDEEIIKLLVQAWKTKDQVIYGVIEETNTIIRLVNVTNKEGEKIEYPINEVGSLFNTIYKNGVFLSTNKKKLKIGKLLSLKFKLSNIKEREKYNNPFLICGDLNSIEYLEKIPKNFINHFDENFFVIDKIFVDSYIEDNYKEEIKLYNDSIDFIKKSHLDLIYQRDAFIEKFNNEQNDLENQKDFIIKDISNLQEKKFFISEEIDNLKEYNDKILFEIKVLNNLKKQEEAMLNNNLLRLREFIKSKADWMLKLDFISEIDYNDLLGIKNVEESSEHLIDFHKDLKGDYNKLIDYVHSYLFNNDIIYPRKLLEDFVTLLRTNDIIVLAGLSGTGKTNLVNSFAKAVNGKAVIIPVKPNWTSSEDLLGFYNPLQKKYLPTAFLESLIEAKRNPEKLYLICLDEMNLARVEYYFADFLSALEERNGTPIISLYSDEEAGHILSEFKSVIRILDLVKDEFEKINFDSFVAFLNNNEVNERIKAILGLKGGESILNLHSYLRRMISGILNIPSTLEFPSNVRIIGSVNIDETTYYLSPKVLDRAHVIRFDSPLNYNYSTIKNEIVEVEYQGKRVNLNHNHFKPHREPYPKCDMNDSLIQQLIEIRNKFLEKIGIDIGYRTLRQSVNYKNLMNDIDSSEILILNNILLHKILPRFSFDGNIKVEKETDKKISDLVEEFYNNIKDLIANKIEGIQYLNSITEIDRLIQNSKKADNIFNYWS